MQGTGIGNILVIHVGMVPALMKHALSQGRYILNKYMCTKYQKRGSAGLVTGETF